MEGMAIRRDDTVRTESGVATTPSTNVNVAPAPEVNNTVTMVTRVVMVLFTVLEVLVAFRFVFKLAGANSGQPLIAALYGVTEPLVRPFQGIFPEPTVGTVVDIAALLAILFLFLIQWLIIGLVRAIAGRTTV
jgi:uncharacterized protein YggT (Ycf19 family)